jgi:hypothetical protein
MGASLGLTFEIAADSAAAQAALADFEKTSGASLKRVAGGTKPLNDALLTNRESVRLLSEELGVHMPRAVSSAVAGMLPDIKELGTGLLAVFAVEEVVKFGEALGKAAAGWGGYTDAVKKAEHADIEASNAALIHFKTVAEGTKFIIETNAQMAKLAKEGENYAPAAKAALKDLQVSWRDLLGPVGEVLKLYNVYTDAQKAEKVNDDEQVVLRQRLIAQMDQLRLLEDQQTQAAPKKEEQARAYNILLEQRSKWMISAEAEIRKDLAADLAAQDKQVKVQQTLNKAQFESIAIMESIFGTERSYAGELAILAPRVEAITTSTKHLTTARKELIGITQQLHQIEQAFVQAEKGEMDAMIAMTQQAADIGGEIASLVGSTKVAAEIRGAIDAAFAVEYMAKYIASYGTDGSALMASIQYGLASAEMFKVAGRGGGVRPSGGGGGGGGGGSQAVERGGGGGGGLNGGNYSQTTIHIQGVISADTLQQFVAQLGVAQSNGLVKLQAHSASNLTAPRY